LGFPHRQFAAGVNTAVPLWGCGPGTRSPATGRFFFCELPPPGPRPQCLPLAGQPAPNPPPSCSGNFSRTPAIVSPAESGTCPFGFFRVSGGFAIAGLRSPPLPAITRVCAPCRNNRTYRPHRRTLQRPHVFFFHAASGMTAHAQKTPPPRPAPPIHDPTFPCIGAGRPARLSPPCAVKKASRPPAIYPSLNSV